MKPYIVERNDGTDDEMPHFANAALPMSMVPRPAPLLDRYARCNHPAGEGYCHSRATPTL